MTWYHHLPDNDEIDEVVRILKTRNMQRRGETEVACMKGAQIIEFLRQQQTEGLGK